MPKFYFHLYNDIVARDDEGKDLLDLDAAREVARDNARFTFAQTLQEEGRANLDHRIDIEDEQGRILGTVWFRDVVRIEGKG